MLLIFLFSAQGSVSSQALSDNALSRFYAFYLRFGSKTLADFLLSFGYWFRKGAHFLEFLGLGFLMQWNFAEPGSRKSFVSCFLFCVLYALSDEIHQYFVPGRAFRSFDILVDSLGSLCGILLFQLPSLFRKKE